MKLTRRSLLAGLGAAAGAAVVAGPKRALAAGEASRVTLGNGEEVATLIDLTKCDGCPGQDTPACMAACRTKNADRFPEPDPAMLKDYWPQPKHEDWSSQRGIDFRLTPYNWIFVQHLEVEHEGEVQSVHVPRRCMHCDNPSCVNLCPFGAAKKSAEGPTYINEDVCMGGAKCRTVCPWDVPQRQAGVGLYTSFDPLPVGGGAMYKCDLCKDLVAEGKAPACVSACPRGAMEIGPRDVIEAHAEMLRARYGGHIYGRDENGGTSTLYVSRVPFAKIDAAIVAKAGKQKQKSLPKLTARVEKKLTADLGDPIVAQHAAPEKAKKRADMLFKPMRMNDDAHNVSESYRGAALATLAAPVVAAVAAFKLTVGKGEAGESAEGEDRG